MALTVRGADSPGSRNPGSDRGATEAQAAAGARGHDRRFGRSVHLRQGDGHDRGGTGQSAQFTVAWWFSVVGFCGRGRSSMTGAFGSRSRAMPSWSTRRSSGRGWTSAAGGSVLATGARRSPATTAGSRWSASKSAQRRSSGLGGARRGQVRLGAVRSGSARLGHRDEAWLRRGKVRHGRCVAGPGLAWQGHRGRAWRRQGVARRAWGSAGSGRVWPGGVRQATSRLGLVAGQAWLGWARRAAIIGLARRGEARYGRARHGLAGHGEAGIYVGQLGTSAEGIIVKAPEPRSGRMDGAWPEATTAISELGGAPLEDGGR